MGGIARRGDLVVAATAVGLPTASAVYKWQCIEAALRYVVRLCLIRCTASYQWYVCILSCIATEEGGVAIRTFSCACCRRQDHWHITGNGVCLAI